MNAEKLPVAIATLKGSPLFSELDAEELSALANRAVVRRFAGGEMLFSEGDPSEGLYIVAAGRVRIFKRAGSGREQVLLEEGPANSVAELPVLDGGVYPASCSAVAETQVLFISRSDFRACCLENPELALKVLQVVGTRLRRLVEIIHELSFATLRQRLISWILREADQRGRALPEGIVLDLGMTHQELAAHVGTVRELVSRNLARLEAENLLRSAGREVVILNRRALETELGVMV
ncbi:MAG TPA: Crp/Fnr family transcriptional regulator [Bryobacteraceae bacterium]|jgi:CRP/FNR family transcriptional regulator|nr:Crp/Fnr family transcriptional regulator [Bryobacteraceae bacterium]